ncbi:MAG: hypothetical protein HOI33_07665 [Rhodospirillaceae bacterium]|jgi:hypothetical protein|nr:hypothetical protein [Rhodospirillaceae bacterium]MBT5659082.1 hypothetical protein [Rhodospirillaceae bacterium]MBT5752573.1 hypothetical protein [Rhodospirillaceae bacterium]
MKMNLGAVLVIVGVIANNYIYLHDLLWQTNDGDIVLGPKSTAAIVVSLIVIAYGLYKLACPMAKSEGE